MKYRDIISAAFFAVLGLVLATNGVIFGLKMRSNMGPGFFPFVVGIILTSLSLILLFRSFHDKAKTVRQEFWESPAGRRKVFFTFGALVAYTLCITTAGFLLSTVALLLFLFRFTARMKWWMAVLGACSAAASAYLIFEVWLMANLPVGILGF